MSRYVTDEPPRDRFSLYRLCTCETCGGDGKAERKELDGFPPGRIVARGRCERCRGEGRFRQEVATCSSAEAVGVALVTLAREGEFVDCPFGLLDREGEVNKKWLVLPWLPSARNVRDAARTLARSKKPSRGE
jgi:hypothetical protein